jgi:hypothetical protein
LDRLRDNSQAYGSGLAILSFPVALYFLTPKPFGLWFGLFCATLGAFGMFGAGVVAYESTSRIQSVLLRIGLLTSLVFGPGFLIATWMFLGHPLGWLFVGMAVLLLWIPCLVVSVVWSAVYVTAFGGSRPSTENQSLGKSIWIVSGCLLSAAILFFAIKDTFFKA